MVMFVKRGGRALVRLLVPLTEKLFVSSPGEWLLSSMAARSVHAPFVSAQVPSPGEASGVSASELTVNGPAARVISNWEAMPITKIDTTRIARARTQVRPAGGYKFIKIGYRFKIFCGKV